MTPLDRANDLVADRLLAARGSIYQAFENTGTGLDVRELERWFIESPAGQSFGDLAGKAFGAALGTAMVAVEADRAIRRKGRWWCP
jgi:hypothetical protein